MVFVSIIYSTQTGTATMPFLRNFPQMSGYDGRPTKSRKRFLLVESPENVTTLVSVCYTARRINMAAIAYVSEVRIEQDKGPLRRAYLPSEPDPVLFGVHGAIAAHYGITPKISDPHATTLDYIVAAAAG